MLQQQLLVSLPLCEMDQQCHPLGLLRGNQATQGEAPVAKNRPRGGTPPAGAQLPASSLRPGLLDKLNLPLNRWQIRA